ncbi:MAG: omptin family outer membrane protease [Myxococcales bacterium]|nr:omptin family outer membrane protease [Myxococcales bacterium]
MLGVLCALAATTGGSSVRVGVHGGYQGGRELFGLDFDWAGGRGASRLEYPADVPLVGATVGWHPGKFAFVVSAETNLGSPSNKMVDQDWWDPPAGGPRYPIGETYSEIDLRYVGLDAAVRHVVVGHRLLDASLVGGLRFEWNDQSVLGAKGWIRRDDGSVSAGSIPREIEAIHYRSRYTAPFLGARIDLRPGADVEVGLEGRVLHAWSNHLDDHVLRHKTSTADMRAFGALAALDLSIGLDVLFENPFRVGVRGEALWLARENGNLHQVFYGDDPGTKADETGSVYDTPFWYSYLRVRGAAYAEVRF